MRFLTLLLLFSSGVHAYDYRAVVRSRAGVLPGVRVVVDEVGGPTREAQTDEAGRIHMEGFTQETIRISFTLEGHFIRKKTVMNFTRRDVNDDVSLVARIPWKLEGRVTRAGAPVAGVPVELISGADAPSATVTDDSGLFHFEPLHDTEFSLRVKPATGTGRFLWQANRSQQDVKLVVDLSREAPLTRDPESRGCPGSW